MAFKIEIKIDGGCRGNGHSNAIGAAAVVLLGQNGVMTASWRRFLRADENQPVTSQRAELTALVMALDIAINRAQSQGWSSDVDIKIYSDSQYVVRCMNEWVDIWLSNGWRNSSGNAVVNMDLIEQALNLEGILRGLGRVQYSWIPRSENADADWFCNMALNENSQGQLY